MTTSTQQGKVLVVDDDRMVADLLAHIFARADYDARVVYNAEAALDALSDWTPDVAVIDVVLPGMNGVGLAASLELFCPDCRILLFSGDERTPNLLKDSPTHDAEYQTLVKPVHPEKLLAEIGQLLAADQKAAAKEPPTSTID